MLLVAGALHLAAAVSAWLSRIPVRGVAADLAPSLLPIAAGYLVAHYYSLLAFQGPRTLALLSDPLGIGANWLGTGRSRRGRGRSTRLSWPSSKRAPSCSATCSASSSPTSARSGSCRTAAVVGQIPLMVLMIGYTVGGLSLLFSG